MVAEGTMGTESDRRTQILDAAFEEFASQGFRGATIKRIAQRASLQSPALIYWYFPTKEELFQAVLTRHLPILQIVIDPAPVRDRPPEEVFSLLAHMYLEMADQPAAQQLLRLLAAEMVQRPETADMVGGGVISKARDFITAYLARQVELGRLRPHDERAATRAFFGMLVPHVARKLLFPATSQSGPTDDEYVASIVAIMLRGLRAEPEA